MGSLSIILKVFSVTGFVKKTTAFKCTFSFLLPFIGGWGRGGGERERRKEEKETSVRCFMFVKNIKTKGKGKFGYSKDNNMGIVKICG